MRYRPGDVILNGRYRVSGWLGRGSLGEVYRVWDTRQNTLRAVHIVARDMPGVDDLTVRSFRERCALAAHLGALLDHPNVLKVFGLEESEGEIGLVMEYAPGGSLQDRLDAEGRLSVDETVRLALEACAGLSAIHERLGAVHRDLKPSNILFGEGGVAKIADLGQAQIPGGASGSYPENRTYASPEQDVGDTPLLPASDVYSLGCVLFECLTGKVYKAAHVRGSRVREHRRAAPLWLEAVVTRALAETPGRTAADDALPSRRYRSAELMRAELERGWRALVARREEQARLRREAEGLAGRPIVRWAAAVLGAAALMVAAAAAARPLWEGQVGAGPAPVASTPPHVAAAEIRTPTATARPTASRTPSPSPEPAITAISGPPELTMTPRVTPTSAPSPTPPPPTPSPTPTEVPTDPSLARLAEFRSVEVPGSTSCQLRLVLDPPWTGVSRVTLEFFDPHTSAAVLVKEARAEGTVFRFEAALPPGVYYVKVTWWDPSHGFVGRPPVASGVAREGEIVVASDGSCRFPCAPQVIGQSRP
ncbi:MAG: serine/threonine protein kinase [Anaerolineae bacterium]|nr:serine/threonine protein kinase [Anaerolineae bacterium]